MPVVAAKWRPALWLVLGGALITTLAMSFAGLVALRYLGPELGYRHAALALALLILFTTLGLGTILVRLLLRPITALQNQTTMLRSIPRHLYLISAPASYETWRKASQPWLRRYRQLKSRFAALRVT